jgi:hypothetical protein
MNPGLGYFPMRVSHGERLCAECGKPFTAMAPRQRFCSVAHEVDSRNRRHSERDKAATRARRKACQQAK